uniref:Uncharacterized protein n=1 Tax=Panagrolaimus sp. PS1159 TaxID=55785 RepID=A0AC35GRI2_9BILA
MDTSPYRTKLRSYSRRSQGDTSRHSQSSFKTPMQRRPRTKRGKLPSPPPTPRANRTMMNDSDATPSNFNSSLLNSVSDDTPKRKSARKSRLSEAPHLVTPGASTKACQTEESGKVKRAKEELEKESRKLKKKGDTVNKTASRIHQQAHDFAQCVSGALNNINKLL